MIEISQPVLILVVGSAGLASNIIGLALFHEHDHGHGGHNHGGQETDHQHGHDIESGEHNHAQPCKTVILSHASSSSSIHPDREGNVEEILPANIVRRASSSSRTVPSRYLDNVKF